MNVTSVSLYKSPVQPIPTPVSENSGSGVNKNTKEAEHPGIEKPASEDTYSPGRTNENDTYSNTGKTALSENVESKKQTDENKDVSDTEEIKSKTSRGENTNRKEFSKEETKEIQDLKSRDIEVKAHEQAHIAAGGQHVNGGAEFEYKTGPDGKRYATGGEVSIDISKVPDNPEATIKKMQIVRSSALAPVNPSQQDRSVASQATRIEMEARAESTQLEGVEKKETESNEETSSGAASNQYKSTGVDTGKGTSLDILI